MERIYWFSIVFSPKSNTIPTVLLTNIEWCILKYKSFPFSRLNIMCMWSFVPLSVLSLIFTWHYHLDIWIAPTCCDFVTENVKWNYIKLNYKVKIDSILLDHYGVRIYASGPSALDSHISPRLISAFHCSAHSALIMKTCPLLLTHSPIYSSVFADDAKLC